MDSPHGRLFQSLYNIMYSMKNRFWFVLVALCCLAPLAAQQRDSRTRVYLPPTRIVWQQEADLISGVEQLLKPGNGQADLTNLKTFLRAKNTQHPQDILQNALVPGGSVKREAFYNAIGVMDDGLIKYLGLSKYDDVIAEGWIHYLKTGSASMLERDCDNYATKVLLEHKYEALTIVPLLGYLVAKEREAQAVRLVMVAKTNDVPIEMAQERLRGLYE